MSGIAATPARRAPGARIADAATIRGAILESFRKLDPRRMVANPVMFVVEVGSVLVTVLFLTGLGQVGSEQSLFRLGVAVWLWGTVVFANFAEALAEGRGKAQATDLRATRKDTTARRLGAGEAIEEVPSTQLELGDLCEITAGETIPCDGEVVEGVATVDESVITGESAPVIRESGGDRSAVTGGTRVLSDRIVVRVTARAGETFLDRMIALVEGAERKKTPNEIALNILLAGLTTSSSWRP